jgi:hypothetical protein
MILYKATIVNYDHNCRFIVLVIIYMIINFDHKTFIVQATACTIKLFKAAIVVVL